MFDLEVKEFDYSQLDNETLSFVKEREQNIIKISNNTRTILGKEYYEVQQKLAKAGYGCFIEWVESIGAKTSSVYRLIAYYENLVLPNWERQTLIESMPSGLQDELSKPSADKRIVQEVLDKEITSMSEYKELLQQKKQLEQQLKDLSNQPPKIIEKEVIKEVIHPLYQQTKEQKETLEFELKRKEEEKEQLKKKLNQSEEKVKTNEALVNQYRITNQAIDSLKAQKNEFSQQLQAIEHLGGLKQKLEKVFAQELTPVNYYLDIEVNKHNQQVLDSLDGALKVVEKWCSDMRRHLPKNRVKGDYIDV